MPGGGFCVGPHIPGARIKEDRDEEEVDESPCDLLGVGRIRGSLPLCDEGFYAWDTCIKVLPSAMR